MPPNSVNNTIVTPMTTTVNQAVRLTGMSRNRIYNEIAAGNIQAVKAGPQCTLIILASLQAFLANLPPVKLRPRSATGQRAA